MSIWRMVEDELRTHPYRTLAVAAGIGCALATRLGRSVLMPLLARAGMSMASTSLAPLLDERLERRPA